MHNLIRLRKYAVFECPLNDFSVQIANELCDKWASQPSDQHIPLSQHMLALSMKALALAAFGSGMKDEKQLLQLSKAYHVVSTSIY